MRFRTERAPWGRYAIVVAVSYAVFGWPAAAQDFNFPLPVDTIEGRLLEGPLQFARVRDTRYPGDRTQRVDLIYPDSTAFSAKWAVAPQGGHAFNNAPRYEVASYALQKLFLPEDSYVVPPTVVRSVPLAAAQVVRPASTPTFQGTASVIVVLQYWLPNVRPSDVWEAGRFDSDSQYARNVANLNVFTYLVRHSDSNVGNFLISSDPANPRVFAVDNGLAFAGEVSDRGQWWRTLRVGRIPRATVERLRALGRSDLDRSLGVLAEWEVRGGALYPVVPGPNLSPGRGVRRSGDRIQLGLTTSEINGVRGRLESLLARVDAGGLGVF